MADPVLSDDIWEAIANAKAAPATTHENGRADCANSSLDDCIQRSLREISAPPEVSALDPPDRPVVSTESDADRAAFLRSEKDTRPTWQTEERATFVPIGLSGYNRSREWMVPGALAHPIKAFGRLATGETPLYESGDDGEVRISDAAVQDVMSAASLGLGGNLPLRGRVTHRSALEKPFDNVIETPNRPQRPFQKDYPAYAEPQTQAPTPLTHDIDGRPLTAKFVAGRRDVGGPDQGLSAAAQEEIVSTFTGQPVKFYPEASRPDFLGRDTYGYFKSTQATAIEKAATEVGVQAGLPNSIQGQVLGHETGHMLEYFASNGSSGLKPTGSVKRELERVYDLLNNPHRDTPAGGLPNRRLFGPADAGYARGDHNTEHVAEALRAYMANPNFAKTEMPRAAAWLRSHINAHPELKKQIQLNSFTGVPGISLANSDKWPSDEGAGTRHQTCNIGRTDPN